MRRLCASSADRLPGSGRWQRCGARRAGERSRALAAAPTTAGGAAAPTRLARGPSSCAGRREFRWERWYRTRPRPITGAQDMRQDTFSTGAAKLPVSQKASNTRKIAEWSYFFSHLMATIFEMSKSIGTCD